MTWGQEWSHDHAARRFNQCRRLAREDMAFYTREAEGNGIDIRADWRLVLKDKTQESRLLKSSSGYLRLAMHQDLHHSRWQDRLRKSLKASEGAEGVGIQGAGNRTSPVPRPFSRPHSPFDVALQDGAGTAFPKVSRHFKKIL